MTVLDRMKLDGRVALVTGGTKGLGKAMAAGLAEARRARREGRRAVHRTPARGPHGKGPVCGRRAAPRRPRRHSGASGRPSEALPSRHLL